MADENGTADGDQTAEAPLAAQTEAQGAGDAGAEAGEGADATLIASGGGEEKPVAAPADFPEDWRERISGGDEKAAKRLARFKSPADVWRSYAALEQRLSSGELKAPLKDGATDEEVASWRKENGIPEAPEGYLEELPEGLVLGDADRPYAVEFAKEMHGLNAPPELVAKAIAWDQERARKLAEDQAVKDREFRTSAEDALRAEWGAEYRANINSIRNMISATAPDAAFADLLMSARLSDGSLFGDNPLAMRWLSGLSGEINPAGVTVPAGGGSQAQSVADEIASIEKVMRTDRKAYNKDPKMQERLRTLYAAQEKLKERAA